MQFLLGYLMWHIKGVTQNGEYLESQQSEWMKQKYRRFKVYLLCIGRLSPVWINHQDAALKSKVIKKWEET